MVIRTVPGNVGLGGIVLIVGVLYYTDAGSILLKHMQSFDSQCRRMAAPAGQVASDLVCGAIGGVVDGVTLLANTTGDVVHAAEEQFHRMFDSTFDGLGSLGDSFTHAISRLSSPAERLSKMALGGPNGLGAARDAREQLQQAVDSFTIGQRYLAQGSGAGAALPWLAYGASQPSGYGLLSQMSLGDLYRNGGHGVQADPLRAQAYYQQAANSLVLLSQSNSPQAQQLLQTLPVSPQVMQQQLLQSIAQIKGH